MSWEEQSYEYRIINDPFIRGKVSEYLTQFLTEQRLDRLGEVLNNRTRHLTVVVEDLFQSQNISAVFRTCECYGVQDVHVIENNYECQVHSAISMGADKWLTIHRYQEEQDSIVRCVKNLKREGYVLVATMPGENSCFLEDLPVEPKTAFLFGTELKGLSDELVALADRKVKIPMYGFTESFNISNSVAIILSHFAEKMRKSAVDWKLPEDERNELYSEWLQKSIKKPLLLIDKFLSDNNLVD
ncbi:RNA methyltransferase [Bacteroidales bacterium OttesenSCG-928-B11]|nr:RNA methyltransferase [Bacteroidales bacterium OttesenSCG-928-E04]MDL2312540.1 RNA methyltransferase [Bacteroidales bacterium OttesenSCG-928-B11]MDL2326497.1 RNA methyltransferase [Bacteroidales bacterium OttesenSCG-928-A14]